MLPVLQNEFLGCTYSIFYYPICPLLSTHSISWKQRLGGGKSEYSNVASGAELSPTPRRTRQIQRPTRQPIRLYEGPSLSLTPPTAEAHLSVPPSSPSSPHSPLPSPPQQARVPHRRKKPPETLAQADGRHLLISAQQADTHAATTSPREAPGPAARRVQGFSLRAETKSPSMEPTAAAAAIPRGGAFGRASVARGARGPRRVVRAALVRPVRGLPRVLVAALPEPLAQEVAAVLELEADKVQVQGGVASAEISSPPAVGTVRVRFVLREQCTFGHSFHLVGDDPALGLWEPANAVALDWSEGHDWTVEKDLPANRLVEFKFLLRDSSGKFRWQDGPNRSLRTGETTKTLVVYEDWSNEKNQKVVEEGDAPIEMVEAVVADDDQSINDVVLANEIHVDVNQEIKEDESSTGDDENSTVADIASTLGEPVNACEADQPELVMDEQKIQDELHDEVDAAPQNDSATTCADGDYGETTDDGGILSKDDVLVKNEWTRAVEGELFWGWKALQQLLGFKMDTT